MFYVCSGHGLVSKDAPLKEETDSFKYRIDLDGETVYYSVVLESKKEDYAYDYSECAACRYNIINPITEILMPLPVVDKNN